MVKTKIQKVLWANSYVCISYRGKACRGGGGATLVFAHLNLNSIRNKFELLFEQVRGNIDVLMASETKIDDSFPIGNF